MLHTKQRGYLLQTASPLKQFIPSRISSPPHLLDTLY